jgi:hypothetical protein
MSRLRSREAPLLRQWFLGTQEAERRSILPPEVGAGLRWRERENNTTKLVRSRVLGLRP